MIKNIYTRLTSLNLGLWLLSLVMLFLAIGSFSRGGSEEGRLNDMPLLTWLQEAPLSYSWWLWICVALLAVLVLNTILCSIESLRRKGRNLAPQVIHLGFLFIVLAHLFSAYGGLKEVGQLGEGGSIRFPDGEQATVERIDAVPGPMGMMKSFSAQLRLKDGSRHGVSPNHPYFYQGYGIYIKDVGMMQGPVALLEMHREPGAIPALVGALFFTLGNLWLLGSRRGK